MKTKTWLALGVGAVAVACGAAAYAGRSGYESAPYKVEVADGAFEVRNYPELEIASTGMKNADGSFMRLFRYIDGGNEAAQKIPMTTPVFQDEGRMIFVLPADLAKSAPAPVNPEVKTGTLPAARMAVYRYSGFANASAEKKAREKLEAWVAGKGLEVTGAPMAAYYDPPWTLPFLRRNEVLVPVR